MRQCQYYRFTAVPAACGVVQALYHSLRGEAEAADECILRRQLQTAANSALAAALTLEQRGELADSLMLPEQKLYPANTLLQVEVLRQKNELLPGRKLTAQAVAADKQITLTTVCLQPPLGQGRILPKHVDGRQHHRG